MFKTTLEASFGKATGLRLKINFWGVTIKAELSA